MERSNVSVSLRKSKGEIDMAELKKGLEGVIAAETKVSSIIDSQLTYAGYAIDDLAENAEFEEIILSLIHI